MKSTYASPPMKSRPWKHIWVYIAIPAIMLLYYNKSANWHYHLTKEGFLIEHAHPYTPANNGKPFQEHEHTDAELIFFAQIMHLTEGLIIAWVALGLFALSQPFRPKRYAFGHVVAPHKGAHTTRGPPSFPR